MHVIVIGAGKLGFEVAKRLTEQGVDVVVIDRDEARLQEVVERLDVLTVHGNGASPTVLQKAGVEKADLVLAVTEVDEVNIIACVTAKHMAASRSQPKGGGVAASSQSSAALERLPSRPLCAARLRNPEYTGSFPYTRSLRQLGVDVVINPDRLAALEIARLIRVPLASHIDFFADGRVSLVGLKVSEDAPLARGTLQEVNPPCLVAAIVREGHVFIPDGSSRVQPGDRVYLVGKAGSLPELRTLVGLPGRPVKEVTIIGGGKVGLPLAQLLLPAVKRGLHVKLIDRDPGRCNELAEALPGVLVICGDGERIDVLSDEMVGNSDVLVAVTSEDHTNLLAVMIAKQLGVDEGIVSVSREDYVPLAERAGADAVVVPRLLAAATALQLLKFRHVLSLSILEEGKAQVLELVVGHGAPAAGVPLRELSELRDAVVGAVVRDGEVLIPTGDTVMLPDDHLIVFALPEAVPRVEALFEGRAPATLRR